MKEKQVNLTIDSYIKLNRIAYNSGLSLSTTLNRIIVNFLRFKKKYKCNDSWLDSSIVHYSESLKLGNVERFHWYASNLALDSLFKIIKLPVWTHRCSDCFFINMILSQYQGMVIKVTEKLSTTSKRELSARARYYKMKELRIRRGDL